MTDTVSPIEELLINVPEFKDTDTNVVLDIDTSKVEDFDKKSVTIQESMGHLTAMNSALVKGNIENAEKLFEKHKQLKTVESELNYGGVELNVTTHREFSNGDGDTLTFFTQAQSTTPMWDDVLDLLGERDSE